MKAYRLGMYEKALPDVMSLDEKMRIAKECGYDHVEFCVDLMPERAERIYWSSGERRKWRILSEDTGMPFTTFSLSLLRKYPLGLPDEEANRKGFDILRRGLELASDLGSRIVLVNCYDVYDAPSTEETSKRYNENIEKAAEICASCGVMVGLENAEMPFGQTVEKVKRIVDRVNSPYLKIYADIANAANAQGGDVEKALADIEKGRGSIIAMHLKDMVPGDYRFPYYGEGQVDFARSISLANDMNVRLFTAELFCYDEENCVKIAGDVNAFLRRCLDAAMNTVGGSHFF